MNLTASEWAELRELVEAVCVAELTASQAGRLQTLVTRSEEARGYYLEYMALHAGIAWRFRDMAPLSAVPCLLVADELDASASSPGKGFLGHCLQFGAAIVHTPLVSVPAVLLFVLAFAFSVWGPSSKPVATKQSPRERVQVAQVVGLHNVRWGDSQKPLDLDWPVWAGDRLELKSGLLKLVFTSGAQVVLEGPVVFVPEASDAGRLERGKMAARAETDRSLGFIVHTPTAQILDLGTEFGVSVDARGQAETHVFDGRVKMLPISSRRTTSGGLRLDAGQAARVEHGTGALRRVKSNPNGFPRVPKRRTTPGAYWRFEEEVPPCVPEGIRQDCVIPDSSGHKNPLSYWPGFADGLGPYKTSLDVPPATMFRPGYSGGTRSFDSGALPPDRPGVLFADVDCVGQQFDFTESFTLEGYFKTHGDQSHAGPMVILNRDQFSPQVLVGLNESAEGQPHAGAIRFTVFDAMGNTVSTALSERNYADGVWHYFAARYHRRPGAEGDRLELIALNSDDTCQRQTVLATPGFAPAEANYNLFVGRREHNPAFAHFRGLIDEVRVNQGVLDDSKLLAPIPELTRP